ncbi:MAG: J domain-containing protein, partial [Actinomycetota bacterium]
RFKETTLAYEVLSDPDKRRRYDTFGDVDGSEPVYGFGGLGDLLDTFFGGGAFGGGFGRQAGPRLRARQGEDLALGVSLSFEEAIFGTHKDVEARSLRPCVRCEGAGCEPGTHPSACPHCQGSGQLRSVRRSVLGQIVTQTPCLNCQGSGQEVKSPCRDCRGEGRSAADHVLSLDFPAGLDDGTRVRFPGRGQAGAFGGPPGDLFVSVRVRPDKRFTRRGDDLVARLKIPMTGAALGMEVTLATLDGDEAIRVEAGTPSGHVLRFKGRGVPHRSRSGRGDLLVELEVETPKDLSGEQEKLLRELAQMRGEEVLPPGGLFRRIKDVLS